MDDNSRIKQPALLYLTSVGLLGFLLALLGLAAVLQLESPGLFWLLLGLAVVAATTITPVPNLSFEVSSAVSAAVIALYGPLPAALVALSYSATAWLVPRPGDWRRSREQLVFNTGTHSLAAALSGTVYLASRRWLGSDAAGWLVAWILLAIVHDQINFWLVMGILRLKEGPEFRPAEAWRENRWAMTINIALIGVGGAFLAYAAERFGWSGVLVFFLPVLLSAYAFRLYVRKMQEHMDNLEAIVAERTREIAALSREKDAFLAVLTHDMRTPLTSIGLYASLIARNPQLLGERPHLTDVILRSQEALLEIVDNILDLEKLQTGGSLPLHDEACDLTPLLERALATIRPQAEKKQIQLEAEICPEPLPLIADPRQIDRLLSNLLSNAVKYTPEGGQVVLRASRRQGEIQLQIADTGYGIPADELPYIFDRYRRVTKHKSIAVGTGLGLAIVRAIVEAHGGRIEVVSQEDVGSTFSLTLPSQTEAIACPERVPA